MKTKFPDKPGTEMDDGFSAGIINVDGTHYGLILPPKAESEHAPIAWNDSLKMVKGALSYGDGLANTKAMAKAGSQLAQWALDNKMHIPSLDEMELLYRHFKPGTAKNACYARSGINLSAVPPTYPYTPDAPKQIKLKAFREGGAEAFELAWYWSSTQRAADSGYAWMQYFSVGFQYYGHKSYYYRARAVRRIKI
jgi:hypothetical protein